MKLNNNLQDKILVSTKRLHHYVDLLISQCDSWLPEEEGRKNVEKRMRRRRTV
jgi:hypothetical protein